MSSILLSKSVVRALATEGKDVYVYLRVADAYKVRSHTQPLKAQQRTAMLLCCVGFRPQETLSTMTESLRVCLKTLTAPTEGGCCYDI